MSFGAKFGDKGKKCAKLEFTFLKQLIRLKNYLGYCLVIENIKVIIKDA